MVGRQLDFVGVMRVSPNMGQIALANDTSNATETAGRLQMASDHTSRLEDRHNIWR